MSAVRTKAKARENPLSRSCADCGAATGEPCRDRPSNAAATWCCLARNLRRDPYTWTPERVAAVCARHAKGTPLKYACALEGGTYQGLLDARARDPETAAAVEHAHAVGGELIRDRMHAAGVEIDEDGKPIRFGDWKREAWLLERWDRVEFAPPTQKLDAKQEHSGANGAPLVVSIETARELARRGRP